MIVQVLLLGFGIALALWDLRLQVIATSEREFCRRKDCREKFAAAFQSQLRILCVLYAQITSIVQDLETLLGIQNCSVSKELPKLGTAESSHSDKRVTIPVAVPSA